MMLDKPMGSFARAFLNFLTFIAEVSELVTKKKKKLSFCDLRNPKAQIHSHAKSSRSEFRKMYCDLETVRRCYLLEFSR